MVRSVFAIELHRAATTSTRQVGDVSAPRARVRCVSIRMIGGVVNGPIDSYELDGMENRSLAASGRYWDVTQLEDGSPAVLVTFDDGSQDVITLKRDSQPASA